MASKKPPITWDMPLPTEKPPRPELATNLPPLETRTCACGCKKTFRVTAQSTSTYATRQCRERAEDEAKVAKKQARKEKEESS